MKMIFFDTETTGLDPKVHGIHQLAGEIVIDGKVIERFEYKIKPFKGCEIVPEAMAVSYTKTMDFKKYHTECAVYIDFTNTIHRYIKHLNDKFFLIGWRVPEFDAKFLKAFFERYSNADVFDFYFWTNPIDVKALASQYLLNKRPEMASFSLAPVAKHLGVEVDESKLHTAAYDAYLSRKVYEIVKP